MKKLDLFLENCKLLSAGDRKPMGMMIMADRKTKTGHGGSRAGAGRKPTTGAGLRAAISANISDELEKQYEALDKRFQERFGVPLQKADLARRGFANEVQRIHDTLEAKPPAPSMPKFDEAYLSGLSEISQALGFHTVGHFIENLIHAAKENGSEQVKRFIFGASDAVITKQVDEAIAKEQAEAKTRQAGSRAA